MAMSDEQMAQIMKLFKQLREEEKLQEKEKQAQDQADAEDSRVGEEEEKRPQGKFFDKLFDRDFHKEYKSFDGNKEEYNQWVFKWKNGFEASNQTFKLIVEEHEMEDEEIDIEKMKKKYRNQVDGSVMAKWSSEFYEILAKKLEGDALVILQGVEEKRCGFEVWRLLRKDCNPTSPAMALKSLVGILTPTRKI